MSFYTELSKYYNEIFPVVQADLDFWVKMFAPCRDILDIGCGTGNKTIFFVRPGSRVTGIDLDPGMIALARREHENNAVQFKVMDMAAVAQNFSPGSFDGLLCLGNSLAHLENRAALEIQLYDMGTVLRPGGLCLIQVLNYDLILDKKIMALPVIETDAVIFDRTYSREGENIGFHATLTVKATGKAWTSTSKLYPLRRGELEKGLSRAGFEPPLNYGTYQGAPFTEDSFILISLSRKVTERQ